MQIAFVLGRQPLQRASPLNIYTQRQVRGQMQQLARDLMVKRGLMKIKVQTWLKVDDKFCQVSLGDESLLRTKEVYEIVKFVSKRLESC